MKNFAPYLQRIALKYLTLLQECDCLSFCVNCLSQTIFATPGIAVRHASVARHVTDCAMRPGGGEGVGLSGLDGGMMKLWIVLGGYRKTGLFLGVISKHSRVFS